MATTSAEQLPTAMMRISTKNAPENGLVVRESRRTQLLHSLPQIYLHRNLVEREQLHTPSLVMQTRRQAMHDLLIYIHLQ